MVLCVLLGLVIFYVFKQKTAYEVRISDWSSDVCSSDLVGTMAPGMALPIVRPSSGVNKSGEGSEFSLYTPVNKMRVLSVGVIKSFPRTVQFSMSSRGTSDVRFIL